MTKVEVIMPKMGESVAEATVIRWCKEVGETIEAEESILEIATDKVDSEIPSPVEGVLAEKLCEEGDECTRTRTSYYKLTRHCVDPLHRVLKKT